jgi:hypothetical protein
MKFFPTFTFTFLPVLFAASSVLAGCGGEDPGESLDAAEEALGIGCEVRAADAVFTGKVDPAHVSPQTYGSYQGPNSCYADYIVNVNNLQAAYTGTGNAAPAKITTAWNGGAASTASACQGQWIESAFYRRENNAWVKVGSSQINTGTWVQTGPLAFCQSPGGTFTGMVAGGSYRVVSSARQGGVFGTLRSLKVQTLKPVNIQ